MLINIELKQGNYPYSQKPTKQGIQRNIDAIQRAIDGTPQAIDFALLIDVNSILKGIQTKLPNEEYYENMYF